VPIYVPICVWDDDFNLISSDIITINHFIIAVFTNLTNIGRHLLRNLEVAHQIDRLKLA